MSGKSCRWWVHYPGEVYANNMDFYHPVSEETAKQEARDWLGVTRLPKGTEVWIGRL